MAFPIRHLPVIQNWDCHVTGTCCKEYRVALSPEERQQIEDQNWTLEELGGKAPFQRQGPFWKRRYVLNEREDGSCVFLSTDGRCRIHERFGYEAKPLACRLYPFVLVPVGDHWRVSVRFACPSAAANKGRGIPEHQPELEAFAAQLAEREKLSPQPDGSLTVPPPFQGGKQLDWPDLLRVVNVLLKILQDRRAPMERRLRKCLTLGTELRKAKLKGIQGDRLGELLSLLSSAADAETPANLMTVPPPTWIGRVLFRQALALFTRKDHGPNSGVRQALKARGRLALLGAALRFARGTGPIPRLHRALPETTFEQAEIPLGPLPQEAEDILERYYAIKVGSLQFCGAASFGLPFWEGFEMLALTYPMLLWIVRTLQNRPREEAVTTALTIVDDHIGFNRILASARQRLSFRILANTGAIPRLIAWYSR